MLKNQLVGLKLSIVDEHIIENLSFYDDSISSTLGSVNGAVCAPILQFKIIAKDALVIDENGFNIQWNNIEINQHSISVNRNGKQAQYKIVSRVDKKVLP